MDLFTTFDVDRILEIKRTRLQEWINHGFIIPSQQTPSKGVKALFSREDLYGIKLFEELLKRGHSRERASIMVNWILGFPVQILEKPVNWDDDYFNIFEKSPDPEYQRKEMARYKKKYGLEPNERFGYSFSYSSEAEKVGPKDKESEHPTFIIMNIHLGTIKKMVDKKIE